MKSLPYHVKKVSYRTRSVKYSARNYRILQTFSVWEECEKCTAGVVVCNERPLNRPVFINIEEIRKMYFINFFRRSIDSMPGMQCRGSLYSTFRIYVGINTVLSELDEKLLIKMIFKSNLMQCFEGGGVIESRKILSLQGHTACLTCCLCQSVYASKHDEGGGHGYERFIINVPEYMLWM